LYYYLELATANHIVSCCDYILLTGFFLHSQLKLNTYL